MEKVIFDNMQKMDYEIMEAYRALKMNLQFCGVDIKTILLTSTTPEEGKSVVTMNLARSIAGFDQKVVYIDCDIRRSMAVGRWGAHTRSGKSILGLSHYLSGQKKLEEIIYETNINYLDVIFAGPNVPNPTELLENIYFEKMLTCLREKYDVVLIDTPPLGSVIDAAVIAPKVDGAILVIEQGKVNRHYVKKVKKQLEKTNVKILGTILNKVSLKKNPYYGKYYMDKYQYK